VIRRLIDEHPYQVKFVVGSRGDCDEIQAYLKQMPEIRRDRVMLMPLGTETSDLQRVGQWLEAYCREHQLHFCPRRHIEWYGFRRGT
jgi:7-carboxy-7-deazaguanine synthase